MGRGSGEETVFYMTGICSGRGEGKESKVKGK